MYPFVRVVEWLFENFSNAILNKRVLGGDLDLEFQPGFGIY